MLQITHQKSQKVSRKEKNHEPKHRDLTHELERWRELVRGENWSHASIASKTYVDNKAIQNSLV